MYYFTRFDNFNNYYRVISNKLKKRKTTLFHKLTVTKNNK